MQNLTGARRGDCGVANRAGFGTVLTVVLTMLFCLAAAGVGHGFYSTFVSGQTQRYAMGDAALDLAENAIACAHFLVGQQANDPDDGLGLYRRFREATGAFSVALPVADLPGLVALLADQPNFRLVDEQVLLEVPFQQPNSVVHATEHDRFGTITLSAAVEFVPTGVVRRLSRTFDMKVSLTAPPRPFDQTTLFIHDPTVLINSFAVNEDANHYIMAAHQRLANLKKATEGFIQSYQNAIDEASGKKGAGAAVACLQRCVALCQQVLATYPPPVTITDEDPVDTETDPNTLHLFPARGTFAVWTKSPKVALEAVNVAKKVKEHRERLGTSDPELVQQYYDRINAFLNAKPRDLGPLIPMQEAWCTEVTKAAGLWYELLTGIYKPFQDTFQEMGGERYQAFEPSMASLESPDDWIARSSTVLVEGDPFGLHDERTVTQKFGDLLGRNESFSSVVYVKNTTQPLVVDRTFAGRMVLVVEGDVTISKALVADSTKDMLTIVSFGRMRVEGPVQAALVAGYRLSMTPEADIRGSLYVRELTWDGAAGDLSGVLEGTLERDGRLTCGPDVVDRTKQSVNPDYQYVTVAPGTVFATVERR